MSQSHPSFKEDDEDRVTPDDILDPECPFGPPTDPIIPVPKPDPETEPMPAAPKK